MIVEFPKARPYGLPDELPPSDTPRLQVSGCYFIRPDGTLHRRRSITAFTLPKRVLEGNSRKAFDFMDWAHSMGANEFRFFSRVDWTGPPGAGVEPGFEYDEGACRTVIEYAAKIGCYVEVVAHTGPYSLTAMIDHLRRVDNLCQEYPNTLLEIANEPPVNKIPLEQLLEGYVPRTVFSSGQYEPTPHPAGNWVNHHSGRDNEWPRKFKDAWEFFTGDGPAQVFTPPFKGPVMLDEPPQVEKTAVPDDWRAYGAGSALFGCGATMHSNPSLQKCEIPEDSTVRIAIRAFYQGLDLVPLQRYHGYNRLDAAGSLRRYTRDGEDGKTYLIGVRPFEFRAL